MQGLSEILIFKLGKFSLAFSAIRVQRGNFEYPAHSHTEVAQTGLTVHFFRILGNSI